MATRRREAQGGAYEARGRYFLRVTVAAGKRRAVALPWVTAEDWAKHGSDEPCPCVACVRAREVQALVTRYRDGGADLELLDALVRSAAAADAGKMAAIERAVDAFCEGRMQKATPPREQEQPLEALAAPNFGGVYFLRSRAPNDVTIKIGHTSTSIRRRIQSLGTAHPWPLDLLAFLPGGTVDDERGFHARFGDLRIVSAPGREWFRPDPELMHLIRTLRAGSVYRRAS